MIEVKLTRVTQNPVDAIEEAACNCYDSEPTGGKIMKSCYNSGHHSVLEFAHFTFHITGVSRALLAQLTRHRHCGFAVRSQRYCNEDSFKFVTPRTIDGNPEAEHIFEALMGYINMQYKKLQALGIPNEDARYVLPNACETTLEITLNGRELIHICNERLCTRAQWEIRQLALLMRKAVKEHDEQCAKFAEFLNPKCVSLGYCPEHSSCGMMPRKKDVLKQYEVITEMIEDLKSGMLTDSDFIEEFWDTFCKED
jgi:thymidylate synthase (FAD)